MPEGNVFPMPSMSNIDAKVKAPKEKKSSLKVGIDESPMVKEKKSENAYICPTVC